MQEEESSSHLGLLGFTRDGLMVGTHLKGDVYEINSEAATRLY